MPLGDRFLAWMHRWMVGYTNFCMDGWTDRLPDRGTYIKKDILFPHIRIKTLLSIFFDNNIRILEDAVPQFGRF